MSIAIAPDHPKCNLSFLFDGAPNDATASAFEQMLVLARDKRDWVIACPQLVDYLDEFQGQPESERFERTYGGVLPIYSALPPWGDKLPREIDRQHYQEVAWLIEQLSAFSKQFGCAFRLQLDDSCCGYIRDGHPDTTLQRGLLDEWKKALGL